MTDVNRCPACAGVATGVWCEIEYHPGVHLLECSDCGAYFLNRVPDDEDLRALYGSEYYDIKDPAGEAAASRFVGPAEFLSRVFRRARARFIQRHAPQGAVLDVGCGRGVMLAELKRRGRAVHGIQIDSRLAALIREKFGYPVTDRTLPRAGFAAGAFGAITMWHLLEHLPDPVENLKAAHNVLAPDGRLILETPNAANPLTRRRPGRWFEIDFPHHLVLYTPASLARLLERTGFEIERISFFSIEFSAFCALQTLLNRVCRERDVIFDALRKKPATRSGRPLTWSLRSWHFFLGAVFALPAVFLAVIWSVGGTGEILRVVCRKRKTDHPAELVKLNPKSAAS